MARKTLAERLAEKEAKLATAAAELKELRKQQERQETQRQRERERYIGSVVLAIDPSMTSDRLKALLTGTQSVDQLA